MRRFALLLVAALCACRPDPAPQPPVAGAYPGQLVSTADMGTEFLMRQRVTATYAESETSFEAVLQLKGGSLTMLALTPFGTKAFVLTQTGTEVVFEKFVERDLPFPPDYILLDIHRALFMAVGEGSRDDGTRVGERLGERISETWANGRLLRRVFSRTDGSPPGEIVVRFPQGLLPDRLPTVMHLDNGWFGYSLEIRTLSGRMMP